MKPIEFIRKDPSIANFAEILEEFFVIRDVIVHNHIWEANFFWDSQGLMRLIKTHVINGYGDNKYFAAINPKNRKTRICKLNLFPTKINKSDAILVIKKVVEFLLFLEENDRNFIYLSPQPIFINGKVVLFTEFIKSL